MLGTLIIDSPLYYFYQTIPEFKVLALFHQPCCINLELPLQ